MRGTVAKRLRRIAAALTPATDGPNKLLVRKVEKHQRYQGRIRRWICDIVYHSKTSMRHIYQGLKREYTRCKGPVERRAMVAGLERAVKAAREGAGAKAQ